MGISWFWTLGAILISLFSLIVKDILRGPEITVSVFFGIFSIGVGLGSVLCNRLLKGLIEATWVPLASLIMAVSIFAFQNTWNDFLGPLVFLQRADVRTIILGLYGLMGMFVEWHLVMAAVVAAVSPLIIVFFVFQRFFVQGITVSGLKG